MQIDQLGLWRECVLRRTARFLALPASARPRSFSAPPLHASTAQLSVHHTGMAERLPMDVSVRSSRYPAFGSRTSIVEQRADPVRAPSVRRGHRPVLAVDNASVRLARPHVHTGTTERLPMDLWTYGRIRARRRIVTAAPSQFKLASLLPVCPQRRASVETNLYSTRPLVCIHCRARSAKWRSSRRTMRSRAAASTPAMRWIMWSRE